MTASGTPPSEGQLARAVGGWQFFSLAFGCIVGVGWVVILGDWLTRAGPIGATAAFVVGAAVMSVIALCYAEIATILPVSGGEMAYAYETFGLPMGYAIGWVLVLVYIGAVAYSASAVAWIADFLVPGGRGSPLYTFRGEPVRPGSLAIALALVIWLTVLNYRGVRSATRVQDLLTYGKLVISAAFIAAGLFGGSTVNLHPLFGPGTVSGFLGVLVTAPWWFGGFQAAVPQVMEERKVGTPLAVVGRLMVYAVGVAGVYYCLVILASGMAAPWETIAHQDLAAAAAFRAAFRSDLLSRVVLLAGLFGAITVGNGTFLAASRLLFALGRASVIGRRFSHVDPRFGTPTRSVLFVGAVATAGTLFGRKGIGLVVDAGSSALAFVYVITCLAVIRLRARDPNRPRPYRVPGGVATAAVGAAAAAFMLVWSLYDTQRTANGGIPAEWRVLGAWGIAGAAFWVAARSLRARVGDAERRRLMTGAS